MPKPKDDLGLLGREFNHMKYHSDRDAQLKREGYTEFTQGVNRTLAASTERIGNSIAKDNMKQHIQERKNQKGLEKASDAQSVYPQYGKKK